MSKSIHDKIQITFGLGSDEHIDNITRDIKEILIDFANRDEVLENLLIDVIISIDTKYD